MFEIRDPIHGFIGINEWEREIINHPMFQRLRRIKQLAWTNLVYPGAEHSRFEHSLGVTHVASQMFDRIIKNEEKFLKDELSFTPAGLERDRVLLRLACLLHDVGHSPFSHAGEGIMVPNPATKKPFKHEFYSAAVVRHVFKDVIENHSFNQNYGITADEVAEFIEPGEIPKKFGRNLLWRNLLSSQLDADRADYLLRDSYHIGVTYGHYDLKRILVTIGIGLSYTGSQNIIAIEEGGIHVAEALILARYQMFTQVYFQHTRRAYDHHIADALKILLQKHQKSDPNVPPDSKDKFPPPTSEENIKNYLSWDDWKVLGLIASGEADEPGERIKNRDHFRCVHSTPQSPDFRDLGLFEEAANAITEAGIPGFTDDAASSSYKIEEDIAILPENKQSRKTVSLTSVSSIVRGLPPLKQQRIYVPNERRKDAEAIVSKIIGG